ncbi:PAS domain-containing protein [Allorhodopirellula solitaria]|uniref:histidine kinase n=1 Tax=Allorhodopirellula solitaria TaxID=2527987 RepID=A0A5C5X1D3_9BACT|nr:PAS domain-containing protein [Allorhodopirellula solitaria]TWT56101.1 Virulence sensor protein BvgS precursor [Allorhodopirellula solitaria]
MPESDAASDHMDREFQSSATYRALANSLPLSVLIKAPDGRRVFANDAYLRWRGVTWEDVIGKVDAELFPPEIAQQYSVDDEAVLAGKGSNLAVERTRLADGSLGWIERVKSPIYDAHGRLIGLQVLFWDVTARVEAEEKSRFEQSLLKTLLKTIPDSIYFKDLESRYIRVSSAMAKKFGHTDVEAILGLTDADVFTPEHAQQALEDERRVIESGDALVDRAERETWPDQDDTWCLTTKMPLRSDTGEIMGTCGISRDITALKRSEAALQEAVRMADTANRAKSEFLANMSHEIRTPMNAMVGMADLLAQTPLDEDQREYVDTIRRSSDSLLRLLNDILDFSKIEARKLELESIVFSLGYEIQAAISTLRFQATEKGLQLHYTSDSLLPNHLIGDPGRLRQILVNLIGNAVKFTDRGSVTVEVQQVPGQEPKAPGDESGPSLAGSTSAFRISIIDTGIGISPAQQAAVLAPFTQADASTTRRFGGTGLGLSITRQLVELMGGTLQLNSEVGVGSSFYFDLELPTADTDAANQYDADQEQDLVIDESVPTQPLRVLVAEDGVTNQHVIAGLLRSLGHECFIASDGREAFVKWRSEPFDLVLMDMHMPVMDGPAATRAIRQQELGGDRHIPIIAVTAAAMAEDARLCRESGMDDFLTKPIRRRKLQEILACIHPAHPAVAADDEDVDERREAESAARRSSAVDIRPAEPAAQQSPAAPFVKNPSSRLSIADEHAECLDLDSARSRIPGGVSGVLRLAAVFKEECQSLVAELQKDILAGDHDAARRNAHTLKGACSLLGADQLQAVVCEIEIEANERQLSDPAQSRQLLQSLLDESSRVLDAVDDLLVS